MSATRRIGYSPQEIEPKWQRIWDERGVMKADDGSPKPKYYDLVMYPYPSGDAHVGHVRNYIIGDVLARTKRMQRLQVLHPFGWDAFGLPAENAAIKTGHPSRDVDARQHRPQKGQLQRRCWGSSTTGRARSPPACRTTTSATSGCSSRFYERGPRLPQAMAPVNWCPVDKTVLANEQVINGRCWRCGRRGRASATWSSGSSRSRDYAERPARGPRHARPLAREGSSSCRPTGSGESEGAEVDFALPTAARTQIRRCSPHASDTLFGSDVPRAGARASPGAAHHHAASIAPRWRRTSRSARRATEIERISTEREKTGVSIRQLRDQPGQRRACADLDRGLRAGAVRHGRDHGRAGLDERDLEFARKLGLPIRVVVRPPDAGG